jgi:hypothetical protein
MITYAFRMPLFPIIIEIDGDVFAARSKQGLEKKLSGVSLEPGRTYEVFDATGEVWFLYADSKVLSPLTLRKRATKLELIKLVNGRKNKNLAEKPYSEKSLSAKTFGTVFRDLADTMITSVDMRRH